MTTPHIATGKPMAEYLFPATILTHEWRQGRRVGRCIHMMVGANPSEEDILIGVFDDPALAEHIVALHNSAQRDGHVPCKWCNDEGIVHTHDGEVIGPCECAHRDGVENA